MPARVSTGDRDAVFRQIRWCAAVQTQVNCHCQLEENLLGERRANAVGRAVSDPGRDQTSECR